MFLEERRGGSKLLQEMGGGDFGAVLIRSGTVLTWGLARQVADEQLRLAAIVR